VTPPTLECRPGPAGQIILRLAGEWRLEQDIPAAAQAVAELAAHAPAGSIRFDCAALTRWDSRLLTFLTRFIAQCEAAGIAVDTRDLPPGVSGLLALAHSVPERQDARRAPKPKGFLEALGRHAVRGLADFNGLAEFTGAVCAAFGRLLTGRARMRFSDVWRLIEECGPNALPIIGLIAVLVGMILAFVGAVQLKLFGAQIFIADLVGLGMAREMGAMMTAILMAGRTGAAFAAELGSMTVNDEIDALKTSGFSPMEFLVLPRIIALFATIPFLCIYADILGILGGALVAAGLFDIAFAEYLIQIQNRLRLIDFQVGIGKSAVFGILVAIAGCMRGLQCQRNATAVGLATTSAVVTGIVFIVISDAVMTLIVTALNVFKR
jgi:phospholipid/cholesterol/gamma-HCH transport system permease protein